MAVAPSTLGEKEWALLTQLLQSRTKLRRFPSLQWSISGTRFIRSVCPMRLLALGLIEENSTSVKGVTVFVATPRAQEFLERRNTCAATAKVKQGRRKKTFAARTEQISPSNPTHLQLSAGALDVHAS